MLAAWALAIVATFLATCAGLWLLGEVGLWWITCGKRLEENLEEGDRRG